MTEHTLREYSLETMQLQGHSKRQVTVEYAIAQQKRLDTAAGRENPYLGMSFNELKKTMSGSKIFSET